MPNIFRTIRTEIRHSIPAIVYFIIAFNLIHFTEVLTLRPGEKSYFSYLTVTIGALVAGKMLILIDLLPFINAFPNKPLAYNITWKFCLYNLFILLFRIAEDFIHLLYDHHHFSTAWHILIERLSSSLFWAIQMWLVLVFFVYVVFSEFIRVLGRAKVKRMLFG